MFLSHKIITKNHTTFFPKYLPPHYNSLKYQNPRPPEKKQEKESNQLRLIIISYNRNTQSPVSIVKRTSYAAYTTILEFCTLKTAFIADFSKTYCFIKEVQGRAPDFNKLTINLQTKWQFND